MKPRCFILDFDGTFTDVEREATPFLEGYRADLARRFGPDLASEWEHAEARVRAAPEEHGWEHGGHVVAPSNSDPFVRATATANILLDDRGLMKDATERTALLQELYATNYRRVSPVFRPEAREVIEALLETGMPTYIVTNSDTAAVKAKVAELAPRGAERLDIRGNARKYVVTEPVRSDGRFDRLPSQVQLDGLPRPLHLRRGHYYELLRDVWEECGEGPAETLVAGDIYELDLALPAHLGARVHLLARPTTPEHERRAVRELHGGTVSGELHPLLTLVSTSR